MVALVVGTLLALAALVYVLWPIITAAEGRSALSAQGTQRREAEGELVREAETPPPATNGSIEDAAEEEIRRARAELQLCPVCGPRPEPGARYCSRCGRATA